jgi:hypothetical protein
VLTPAEIRPARRCDQSPGSQPSPTAADAVSSPRLAVRIDRVAARTCPRIGPALKSRLDGPRRTAASPEDQVFVQPHRYSVAAVDCRRPGSCRATNPNQPGTAPCVAWRQPRGIREPGNRCKSGNRSDQPLLRIEPSGGRRRPHQADAGEMDSTLPGPTEPGGSSAAGFAPGQPRACLVASQCRMNLACSVHAVVDKRLGDPASALRSGNRERTWAASGDLALRSFRRTAARCGP